MSIHNIMSAPYYCPRCQSREILEYSEFIECPKCRLDFDKDLFGKIPDKDILSRQEMVSILKPFKKLQDKNVARQIFNSILNEFDNDS